MGRASRTKALRAGALASAAVLAGWTGSATAQNAANGHPSILKAPTGDEVARFYPERAQRMEVQGRVRLGCTADSGGLLVDCRVIHEWPRAFGFGAAALQLSHSFRASGPGPITTRIVFALDCGYAMVSPGGRAEDAKALNVLSCPSSDEQDTVFPGGDKPLGAALNCWLSEDGRLDGCTGASGDRAAIEAAKTLAPLWRIEKPGPRYVHGVAQVSLTFTPPDPGPAADVPPTAVAPSSAPTAPVIRPVTHPDSSEDDGPHIVASPSAEDFARFYPDRAQRFEVTGRVRLVCEANDAGLLDHCSVHEWPIAYGFGEAALKMAPLFRVSRAGTFRTSINFSLSGDEGVFATSPKGQSRTLRVLSPPGAADRTAAYSGDGTRVQIVSLACTLGADGSLAACTGTGQGQDGALTAADLRLIRLYRIETPEGSVGMTIHLHLALIPPDPADAPHPGAPS